MKTTSKLYRIVANLKDGRSLWLRKGLRHGADSTNREEFYTTRKQQAWKDTEERAEDFIQRLHHVQAQGHCWKEVLHFSLAVVNK